ncbi:transcriptional repressor [Poseidonibacter lekithochrous]|uniref:Fur family transcriptional regulator n=1 Tax=Poseidonibacter TaxID=2321187 RepID=UPI001C08B87B|nr:MULTISPECIES: transcriptional repressor [Poseidonibacter]MBU3015820.1 transcriptional repressor [Poseidonibacter lekithochrous]MDO6829120.1 transcriptional repressor [Poseidonibacter sp. 1_MG-2023]
MNNYKKDFNAFLENFKKHVSKSGLKNSIQKDYILKILYFAEEHLSVEQIANDVKVKYKIDIGIATVYRSMKFFEELNIVESLDVGDGIKRYELNLSLHHDHLVCTSCSKIIEFTDEIIEEQQLKVASDNNFDLKDHVMTIYGICEDCQ